MSAAGQLGLCLLSCLPALAWPGCGSGRFNAYLQDVRKVNDARTAPYDVKTCTNALNDFAVASCPVQRCTCRN